MLAFECSVGTAVEILDQNWKGFATIYSKEQVEKAISTFIRFDHSYADTIRALGYPDRQTLWHWWKSYRANDHKVIVCMKRKSKYSEDAKRKAVNYYLEHGENISRTIRKLGYPKSREYLRKWIDELAPEKRKTRQSAQTTEVFSEEQKIKIVAELEGRTGTASELAEHYGIGRTTAYVWRRELMKDYNHVQNTPKSEKLMVSKAYDELPEEIEALKLMADDLRVEVRRLQIERDVHEAALEILKKKNNLENLSNRDKARLVTSLRSKWKLKDLLEIVRMAKSSYEYAMRSLETQAGGENGIKEMIIAAYEVSGGSYGYRRILHQIHQDGLDGPGEWTIRRLMKATGLEGRRCKKRNYNSYAGELSEAPDNTCRNEDGKHDFSADQPNELWVTDLTEFGIPAGKVYLSPIIDCFDGMPVSWSISTSPNAEMANASLKAACSQLSDSERPRVHSDIGAHYRWPGCIAICDEHELIRSMSRKGRTEDNTRAEGFFGRLKVEFFHNRDWQNVTVDRFMNLLDGYLRWYREERLKSDLGYMSPKQYRLSLGLAA